MATAPECGSAAIARGKRHSSARSRRESEAPDALSVTSRPLVGVTDGHGTLTETPYPLNSTAGRERGAPLALGSAGVPESFVVDGRGIIRHQHVGPIEPADVPEILAQLEQAR